MTRKLLLTTAIVALTLAPSIGTGTVQARGFYGGGFGRGFYGGFGGFYPGFTAMAISRTATTVTDHLQLAP